MRVRSGWCVAGSSGRALHASVSDSRIDEIASTSIEHLVLSQLHQQLFVQQSTRSTRFDLSPISRASCRTFTARGSDGSIVFSIVAKFFFSVNTITHEPLHLAWWNFARTCTLTTSRTLKVIGQRSRSHVFVRFGLHDTRGQYFALSEGFTCTLYRYIACLLLTPRCGRKLCPAAAEDEYTCVF